MQWFFYVIIALAVVAGIYKAIASRGGAADNPRLRGYGVVVDGQQVKSGGVVLGPLAGSEAIVTDGTSRHTLTRVVTVAGALTKKTEAAILITCPGAGVVKQEKLKGAAAVRSAQSWAVRFNALATDAGPGGSPA